MIEYLAVPPTKFAAEKNAWIVIDANCQGIFECSLQHKVFKKEFPLTYKWFVEQCIRQTTGPGDCLLQEENGYNIAILVTSLHIEGCFKDSPAEVELYTEAALDSLFEFLNESEHEEYIASFVMNRKFKNMWSITKEIIIKMCETYKFKNWKICTQ